MSDAGIALSVDMVCITPALQFEAKTAQVKTTENTRDAALMQL